MILFGFDVKCPNGADLRLVCCGANDELFQRNSPILAGAHPHSLYCYLLRRETHRDYETWAINLLDLVDKGFNPNYGIADNGQGLRKSLSGKLLPSPNHS